MPSGVPPSTYSLMAPLRNSLTVGVLAGLVCASGVAAALFSVCR